MLVGCAGNICFGVPEPKTGWMGGCVQCIARDQSNDPIFIKFGRAMIT